PGRGQGQHTFPPVVGYVHRGGPRSARRWLDKLRFVAQDDSAVIARAVAPRGAERERSGWISELPAPTGLGHDRSLRSRAPRSRAEAIVAEPDHGVPRWRTERLALW